MTPPRPQVIAAALTTGALLAISFIPPFRCWSKSASIGALMAVHLSRFVGAYFLILSRRGALPAAFAIPAGWGDLFVAATAVILLLTANWHDAGSRRLYLAWNVLGLIDILLVVVNAARIGMASPSSMAALTRWPLCLLPTYFVPLIIVSHILIFRRLAGTSGRTEKN